MPRKRAHTVDDLVRRAMERFWRHGFGGTSAADLVAATGVSRHGIYAAFDGKRALFAACFDVYQEAVVTPALAPVEAPNADLGAVRAYFTRQFDSAEARGAPGPGCLVANTLTELAAHDEAARRKVQEHHERLKRAFLNVFRNMNAARAGAPLPADALEDLAEMLAISTQGLWSMSRAAEDLTPLRRHAETLLSLIEQRFQ